MIINIELEKNFQKDIVVVKDKVENQITSCKIRKTIARGRSIKYLVNDAVERYIRLHNLYTDTFK